MAQASVLSERGEFGCWWIGVGVHRIACEWGQNHGWMERGLLMKEGGLVARKKTGWLRGRVDDESGVARHGVRSDLECGLGRGWLGAWSWARGYVSTCAC